jgi:hypothetical protein
LFHPLPMMRLARAAASRPQAWPQRESKQYENDSMKSKPTPERVLNNLGKIISVWEANEDFAMGTDVTLKKMKDTQTQLGECITKLDDLDRQVTIQADQRDDCSRTGQQLVVRARKSIAGFFGPDSTQYAQAGGTRTSERKRPVRKTPLDKAA